jgi:pilin isopeptide linkage protein
LITTGTNDANGKITFPTVTFDEAGEHNYTIQETTPDGEGFTTDKASYPYKIVITDDGLGTLHAVVTQPTPTPTFVNTYSAAGSEAILAYKSLQGWDSGMTAPTFTFTLNDQSGQPMKTIQSTSGTLDFGVLEYTEPGDYAYTVNEETPLPPAWSTPVHSYRIIVHMEPDGKGGLIGTISYPDSADVAPEFVNTYTALPANVGEIITNNPSGQNPTKTISGSPAAPKDSQFKFGIYDESGNLVAYGFNDANGRIRVPVFYLSQLGTWNYTMKEITPDGKGWTTDQTSYPMRITIRDDGVGHRTADVQYPSGVPTFHNTYKAADATANIKGKVIGTGKTVDDGEFHFDLVDGDGKKVGEMSNDANSTIVFPPLELPEGDYHFQIVAPPNGNGWTFDVPNLPVNVHVTDNGDGTSTANVTYPNGDTFHQTYKPLQPAHATVRTRKGVYGATLLADEFTFVLEGDDGSQYATAKNDACGNVTFPRLTFTMPGVYHYTIRELCVSTDLWRCDSSTFGVTITVTDNGQGELTASVRYDDGSVQMFKNYYKPAGYS